MNHPESGGGYSTAIPRLVNFATVRPTEHTPGGTLHVLHGDEQGLGAVSLLLSWNPPNGGPPVHTHPYVEIFVVQEGRGVYRTGDESFEATVGDVVVVPPDLPHTFQATDDSTLTHLAIHQAAHSVSFRVQ